MTEAEEIAKLDYELNQVKTQYKNLAEKVRNMMDCQQAYFKSKKDWQLLKKSKVLEDEVREILDPKPVSQGIIDFLAR